MNLNRAREVKEAVERKIFEVDKENITTVYLGYKVTGGKRTDKIAIVVGVKKKKPLSELPKEKVIPKTVEHAGITIPTDVVETGEIRALGFKPAKPKTPGRTDKLRPAPPGVSVAHFKITAGTFGLVAVERVTGREVAVSNEHVFTSIIIDDESKKGDLILQPGPYDGGTSPDADWAKLERWGGISPAKINYYDGAYAIPIDRKNMVREFYELKKFPGKVKEVRDLGEVLIKDGRSCGVATGSVIGLFATVRVNYNRFIAEFRDQILTTPMLIAGDSGSAILDANDYEAIAALGFAGSEVVSVMSPIRYVLDGLELNLPTGVPKRYLPSESSDVEVKVHKIGAAPSKLTLATDKPEYYEGDTITAFGELIDAITGEGIPARDISLSWDGNLIKTTTDALGKYKVEFKAPPVIDSLRILKLKTSFAGD